MTTSFVLHYCWRIEDWESKSIKRPTHLEKSVDLLYMRTTLKTNTWMFLFLYHNVMSKPYNCHFPAVLQHICSQPERSQQSPKIIFNIVPMSNRANSELSGPRISRPYSSLPSGIHHFYVFVQLFSSKFYMYLSVFT